MFGPLISRYRILCASFTVSSIEKALRELRKQGAAINVNTVAQRAQVTRKTIYHHKDLLARIRAHTQLAPAPTPDDRGSNNIVAALRIALSAKDNEIAALTPPTNHDSSGREYTIRCSSPSRWSMSTG